MATDSLSTALRRIGQNVALTESGIQSLKYRTQQSMFLMKRAVESTTIAFGLLGVSIMATYKNMVESNKEIERMTTLIASIQPDAFDSWDTTLSTVKDSIRNITLQLPNTTEEVAKLQLELAKMGKTGKNLEDLSKNALILGNIFDADSAKFGQLLGTTVDMSEFKNYGDATKRVSAEIATAIKTSKLDLTKLQYSVQNAQGTFEMLGFNFEELLASATLVADKSMLTPTRLGSGLNIFARAVATATGKLTKLEEQQLKAMDETIDIDAIKTKYKSLFVDEAGHVRSFNDILINFKNIINEAGDDTERLDLVQKIFGRDGATVVNTLITHWDDYEKIMSKITDTNKNLNIYNEMQKKYTETTASQLELLSSRWQVLTQNIYDGTKEARNGILSSLNDLIGKFLGLETIVKDGKDYIESHGSVVLDYIIGVYNEMLDVLNEFVDYVSIKFDELNSYLDKHEDELRRWYFNFKSLLSSLKNTFGITIGIIKSILVSSGIVDSFKDIATNGVVNLKKKLIN